MVPWRGLPLNQPMERTDSPCRNHPLPTGWSIRWWDCGAVCLWVGLAQVAGCGNSGWYWPLKTYTMMNHDEPLGLVKESWFWFGAWTFNNPPQFAKKWSEITVWLPFARLDDTDDTDVNAFPAWVPPAAGGIARHSPLTDRFLVQIWAQFLRRVMTLWLPVTESLLPLKSCETSTETAKWVRWPGPLGIMTPQPFLSFLDDYSISFPSKIGIAMLDSRRARWLKRVGIHTRLDSCLVARCWCREGRWRGQMIFVGGIWPLWDSMWKLWRYDQHLCCFNKNITYLINPCHISLEF